MENTQHVCYNQELTPAVCFLHRGLVPFERERKTKAGKICENIIGGSEPYKLIIYKKIHSAIFEL